MVTTFSDVIALWPNSEELGKALKIKGPTVRKWRARDRIPPEYWAGLVAAAEQAGIDGVSLDLLARLAGRVHNTQAPADQAA